MANEIVETKAIEQVSDNLYKGVSGIIDNARQEVVVYVNKHSDLMFWHIGHYINEDMGYKQYSAYGSKILATLSQRLTARYGKGYTYTAVTRMMKVARFYSDEEMFATLSQTLTWSHFLELVTIEDNNKRLFYQQMGIAEHWSVRQLSATQFIRAGFFGTERLLFRRRTGRCYRQTVRGFYP